MTGIGRNQLDRTTAVIGKKRKIAKRSVPEDDDLESISDKNEDGNGDYLIGDEALEGIIDDAGFTAVDEVDAEVVSDNKPNIGTVDTDISLEGTPAESDIEQVAGQEALVKQEVHEHTPTPNNGDRGTPVSMEDSQPPLDALPTETVDIGVDNLPLHPHEHTGPATPISTAPVEVPASRLRLRTTTIPTPSTRSDSPLSILEITPPPPSTCHQKTKKQSKSKTRIKSEPPNEDHLDTSPPELAILTPHGLGEVTCSINNHFIYLFYRFCAERHKMFVLRTEGVSRDELTNDECMKRERVGNIYRDLDPSSKRLVDWVIGEGDQANEEICFRVFLYSGFYHDQTYQALIDGLGEIPSWKTFNLDKYESILYERSIIQKKVIYTSAFQLVPPTMYYGRNLPHFAATLRFIMTLMKCGLPSKLLDCKYAVDASHILQTFPTLGGFLAQNILVSLNDAPTLNFQYRIFATCGPGSRSYLQRIFGKEVNNHVAMEQAGLKWLYDNQWRYYARLNLDPPHAWEIEKGMRPGMRVLDIENALCWCHRYVNAYQRKGYKSLADIPPPTYDPELTENTSMPAWCDEESQIKSSSRASFIGDYEEESLKQQEEEEGIWEIEKVNCRKGNRTDKDGLFRVRWKGYPPEDDTWERGSSLKEGAEECLKEWLEWEEGVWSVIAEVTKENPYTRPWPGMKVEPKEEKPDMDEAVAAIAATPRRGASTGNGKRGRRSGTSAGPSTSTPRPKRARRGEDIKVES